MKNSIYLSVLTGLALLLGHSVNAQRHMRKEMALSIYGGRTINKDDFFENKKFASKPLVLGMDWVKYYSSESYLKIGLDYSNKPYTNRRVESYLTSVDYAFNFLESRRRWFYLSPVIGIFGGYEKGQLPPDSARIANNIPFRLKERPIVGAQAGLESELYFSNSSCVILGVKMRYSPFAVDDKMFHPTAYVGLRFGFFKGI